MKKLMMAAMMAAVSCFAAETNQVNVLKGAPVFDPLIGYVRGDKVQPTYTNLEISVRDKIVFDRIDFSKTYTDADFGVKPHVIIRTEIRRDKETKVSTTNIIECSRIFSVTSTTENVPFPCRYSVILSTNGQPQSVSIFIKDANKKCSERAAIRLDRIISYLRGVLGEEAIETTRLRKSDDYTIAVGQFRRDKNSKKLMDTLKEKKATSEWEQAVLGEFGSRSMTAVVAYSHFKDMTVMAYAYYDKDWSSVKLVISNPRFAAKSGFLGAMQYKRNNRGYMPLNMWVPMAKKK